MLNASPVRAQAENGDRYANLPVPHTTNCYGNLLQRSAAGAPTASPKTGASAGSRAAGIVANSTFGSALTPRGDVRILVIFAGFTEDLALSNSGQPLCSDYNDAIWPQDDHIHPIGTALPQNLDAFGYSSASQFRSAATDYTASNFLYQMSHTATSPFKVAFDYFPQRINISASAAAGGNIVGYGQAVLNQIDQLYPNYDWSPWDQRINDPGFQTDNSGAGRDGKLDYVVICFRTGNCSRAYALPPSTGLAGVPYHTFPATSTRPAYTISTGHMQTGMELETLTFLHEFSHTLYNSPHMWGVNRGTTGQYWNQTYGWGMMANVNTFYSTNAWERWFLGWTELRTGLGQDDSDIQDETSLAATNGIYTLRDFITTGDAVRIRLPRTNQFLWLENRAKKGPFDQRFNWTIDGSGAPFAAPPQGLVAMVEDMAPSREQYGVGNRTNGLRTVSAQGNYDYTWADSRSSFNYHLWSNNSLLSFSGPQGPGSAPVPNPTGNHSELTVMRFDANNDGVIDYNPWDGNGSQASYNESLWDWVERGTLSDGVLGPHIGTRAVGFRYALDSNPVIIPHQAYDQLNEKLSQIPLNGLSVEIIYYDAASGDLKIRVRYDDTQISRNTRWTGDLKTYPVRGATNGSEIYVYNGVTLTLDRSGTAQRQHPGPHADFVNDTRLTVSSGTRLTTASAANLELRGQGTQLYVDDNARVYMGGGGYLLAAPGTSISVRYRSDLQDNGQLILKTGSQLIIRSTGQVIPGNQRPFPVAAPNPAVAGTISLAWEPDAQPADAAAYRYDLQDLQGHSLRRGTYPAGSLALPGIAPGLYLLVMNSPEGERQTRRVEVR